MKMDFGLSGRLMGTRNACFYVCLCCFALCIVGTCGEYSAEVGSSKSLETSSEDDQSTTCQLLLAQEDALERRLKELIAEIQGIINSATTVPSGQRDKKAKSDDVFVPSGLDNLDKMSSILDRIRLPLSVNRSNFGMRSLREKMRKMGRRK